MFWNKIGFALQVVLVIVGVLVFAYFDPFGLLVKKKKTLQDTPVSVVSIREIGELVTAEYYGEVLTSLHETEIKEVDADGVAYKSSLGTLKADFFKALERFVADKDKIETRWWQKRKDLYEYFYEENRTLIEDPFYNDMLEICLQIIRTKEPGKNSKPRFFNSERTLLRALFDKDVNVPDLRTAVEGSASKPATEFNNAIDVLIRERKKEMTGDKKFLKRQIIMIGRGWVRAGYKFDTFSERNFRYDARNKTIYLFNMQAEILNCDINPWFIPEKKVKGFEIIAATNKAKNDAALNKVKQACVDELQSQATRREILKHARVNAEESLKNFFSLLLAEPIERVLILESPLELAGELLKSRPVPAAKLFLMDPLLQRTDSIMPDSTRAVAWRLRKEKFILRDSSYVITPFSAEAAKIAEDGVMMVEEYERCLSWSKRPLVRLDSLWNIAATQQSRIDRKSREYAFDQYYKDTRFQFFIDSVRNKGSYPDYVTAWKKFRSDSLTQAIEGRRKADLEATVAMLKQQITTLYLTSNKVVRDTARFTRLTKIATGNR